MSKEEIKDFIWPTGCKYDVGQIADILHLTLNELADLTGIPYNHLRLLSSGNARVLGKDMVALHEKTGIPMNCIKT